MKFIFALATLVVLGAPTLASAEPAFWCESKDSNLSVSFSSPATHATVQTGGGDALRIVASLDCQETDAKSRADQAFLECGAKGSEYRVQLNQKTGSIQAMVTQADHAAAVLNCGRQ